MIISMLTDQQAPAQAACVAIKRYGRPEKWRINPIILEQLGTLDLIQSQQLAAAVCSTTGPEARAQNWVTFLGRPVLLDWNEPFENITMEVVTLRSLWDELP